MTEIWRDIVGYEGYQVSNCGRVRSFKSGEPRILKPIDNGGSYLIVNLYRDGKGKIQLVHRLVAAAFIPNPESKSEINHINGIKNDNRAENLEWSTHSENQCHAYATGLSKSGEDHYRAKFTNEQVMFIRSNPDGLTVTKLAQMFGVNLATITYIQTGKTYKMVGGDIRTGKPFNPRRIPDEIRQQIRAEYKPGVRGCGRETLAKKFGVSPQTILNIAREN